MIHQACSTSSSSFVVGVVERGRQLGRVLGFPTANIGLAAHAPVRTGVHAARVTLPDGREFDAVASVGCNPTVPKDNPVLEAWIFDFNEDIYDQLLTVELVAWLRAEECFPSLTALRAQVMRDADAARARLAALRGADRRWRRVQA